MEMRGLRISQSDVKVSRDSRLDGSDDVVRAVWDATDG